MIYSCSSAVFKRHSSHTKDVCAACVHDLVVAARKWIPSCQDRRGANLRARATIKVVSHPLNICHVESVGVCVCVRLTANGAVVRHQVLSPVDKDRGQTHVSWSTVSVYCVHPLWQENVHCYKIYIVLCQDLTFPTQVTYQCYLPLIVFIFTFPSSSRGTILSAELSFRHQFMSSVDHSTADAMKPRISKGYHLGSVNSSLVNLYLTPPCPSLSPSCVTLSS